MPIFDIRPLQFRAAPPPTQAFASTVAELDKKYKEGELLTENAKDVFGLMPVAIEDQVARNAYAEEVMAEYNKLLDEYEGAYESNRYQQEARRLQRKFLQDSRIPAWQQTLEEEKRGRAIELEAQAKGRRILFNDQPIKSTYNEETGMWKPGQYQGEQQMDYFSRAKQVVGEIKDRVGPLGPDLVSLFGGILKGIRTGRYRSIDDAMTDERAREALDLWLQTEEADQLSRNWEWTEGKSLTEEEREARHLEYLASIASQQQVNAVEYSYSFPSFLNKSAEGVNATNDFVRRIGTYNTKGFTDTRELPDEPGEFEVYTPADKKKLERLRKEQQNMSMAALSDQGVNASEANRVAQEIEDIRQRAKIDYTGIGDIVFKAKNEDGTLDKEYLKETGFAGLDAVFYDILQKVGMTEQDYAALNGDHPTKQYIDRTVRKAWNTRRESYETTQGIGLGVPNEDTRKYLDEEMLGGKTSNFGAVSNMNIRDEEGNSYALNDILKELGVDTESASKETRDKMKAVKDLTYIKGVGMIPGGSIGLHLSIGGKDYFAEDNTFAYGTELNRALLSIADIQNGVTNTSDYMTLPLINTRGQGRWVANNSYDADGTFTGSAPYFQFDEPDANGRDKMSLSEYLKTILRTHYFTTQYASE